MLRKYFSVYITFFALLLFCPAQVGAHNSHFWIDFGAAATPTNVTGWNNIDDSQAGDTSTSFTLVDTAGAATPFTLKFTNVFDPPAQCGANTSGTTGSTLYPANATRDSFYVSDGSACTQDTSGAFNLQGLTNTNTYDVRFYASRVAGDAADRTGDYTIGATTVSLNATDNVNSYVEITGVSPSSGVIGVTVAKGANAHFGYLGVLEVTENVNQTPVASAGTDQAITLPTSSVTLTGSGTDSDGTIASYAWSETTSSGATIVSASSASTQITGLGTAGTFTFRLTVTDNLGLTSTDDVNVVVSNIPATTVFFSGGGSGFVSVSQLSSTQNTFQDPLVSPPSPSILLATVPAFIPPPHETFTRDLRSGVRDEQVMALQKYLNKRGYTVALFGPGSIGNETDYFGKATLHALIQFQITQNIRPASGYFGPATREFVSKHVFY